MIVGVSGGTRAVPALPGASREVDRVQETLERGVVRAFLRLSGERVTRDSLREEMQRAGLVHLACHGTLRRTARTASGSCWRDDGA